MRSRLLRTLLAGLALCAPPAVLAQQDPDADAEQGEEQQEQEGGETEGADVQDAPATPEMKKLLKGLTPEKFPFKELAGEKIESVLNRAPANNEPLGGVKVNTAGGWFAARPSGTENVYKIYAESFRGPEHLDRIFTDAETMIAGLAA